MQTIDSQPQEESRLFSERSEYEASWEEDANHGDDGDFCGLRACAASCVCSRPFPIDSSSGKLYPGTQGWWGEKLPHSCSFHCI